MNERELKIRYLAKIRGWYERFEALSDITDKLQKELEAQRKIVEKVACQNVQVIQELRELQEQQTEMEFDQVELEKQ